MVCSRESLPSMSASHSGTCCGRDWRFQGPPGLGVCRLNVQSVSAAWPVPCRLHAGPEVTHCTQHRHCSTRCQGSAAHHTLWPPTPCAVRNLAATASPCEEHRPDRDLLPLFTSPGLSIGIFSLFLCLAGHLPLDSRSVSTYPWHPLLAQLVYPSIESFTPAHHQ